MLLFGARAAQGDESALHALGDFTANARLLLLSSVAILIGISLSDLLAARTRTLDAEHRRERVFSLGLVSRKFA